MATTSEVKSGIDTIADEIAAVRKRYATAKSNIEGGAAALENIPTKWDDVLTTVNGYTGADAFETLAKSEVSKLAEEYTALKADIDALISAEEF